MLRHFVTKKMKIIHTVKEIFEMEKTITLTFGDQAENHVRMQKIGQMAESGFSLKDLARAKTRLGSSCELICLNDFLPDDTECTPAYILIIRGGVDHFLSEGSIENLLSEQENLEPDKKAFMYGRVCNKNARWNLCFGKKGQPPDYENKKGRIVPYSDVPVLNSLRLAFPKFLGRKAKHLVVEGNYYYNIYKCGIGFHGDAERRKVIAVRLGASLPLHYQWFQNGKPVGKRVKLLLNHGDMYVMSEKAVGTDWRKRKILTLRHAAGCDKFLKIKGSLG